MGMPIATLMADVEQRPQDVDGRWTANRFRSLPFPSQEPSVVDRRGAELAGMDAQLEKQRQQGRRHAVDARRARRGLLLCQHGQHAAIARRDERRCQTDRPAAKDDRIVGPTSHEADRLREVRLG